MKNPSFVFLFACSLILVMGAAPARSVQAQENQITAGVAFHSVPPYYVCVGDRFQFQAAAGTSWPEYPPDENGMPIRLAPLAYTNIDISAALGAVSPVLINHPGDGLEFAFTYTAAKAGIETVTLTVNQGLAQAIERFEVHESCDYDAYLLTVMHMTVDIGDGSQQYLTRLTGTGMLKHDRQTSQLLQGDGRWYMQETQLTKPAMCVEWYIPPLLLDGPFKLDGRLADEGDSMDVKLSFLSQDGPPVFHGVSKCIDEEGELVEGWGFILSSSGDPSLASQINSTYPLDGGSNQVEMQGKGMEMVEAQSQLDYQAFLTIIPR